VSLNSLELQLATAMQRFNTLQRRVDAESGESTSLMSRALHELERALEEVRVAQDQLIDNRSRMEQLHEELAQQYRKYADLFDEMPQPYIVTRSDTTIIEANKAAAEFLNVSPRFLVGKALSVFVCENRTQFLQDCAQPDALTSTELKVRIRPRERAPIDVIATVRGRPGSLRWVLRAVPAPVTIATK
jgi:PAS domain-containing protein